MSENIHQILFTLDEEKEIYSMGIELGIRNLNEKDIFNTVIRAGLNSLKEDLDGKKSLFF